MRFLYYELQHKLRAIQSYYAQFTGLITTYF